MASGAIVSATQSYPRKAVCPQPLLAHMGEGSDVKSLTGTVTPLGL